MSSTFAEYDVFDGIGLAQLIRDGVLTPKELVTAAIERIEALNPALNAVIYKMYDLALAAANQSLPSGIFKGVPFLLKDLHTDYAGVPIFYGSHFIENGVSRQDAEMVCRMKKAGLIILGRTSTPEFGLSALTESKRFGVTRNPWNINHTSGGSSGGSAVAVAAGMVPMAHGSDGAGSIRIPASYCGIFGLKPSRGRTPAGPSVMQNWQGMVTEHVLTRSVRDSAAMLDVLSGPELGSLISLPEPKTTFLSELDKPVGKLRIAWSEESFFPSTTINPEYKKASKQAAELCEALGHTVEVVNLNINYEEVLLAFFIVIAASVSSDLRRLAKEAGKAADYARLETATAVLCEAGEHFSAADYTWATHVLDMLNKKMAEFFVNYDVLLSLTMPAPPLRVGESPMSSWERNGLEFLRRFPFGPILRKLGKQMSQKQFSFTPFTPLFNMTGQPAMSVPLYWDSQGLPIGIQFAGRMNEESILLRLAKQLESAQPWENKRPKFDYK